MSHRFAIIAMLTAACCAAPPLAQVAINDATPRSESLTATAGGALIMGSMTKSAVFRAPAGAATAEVWIQPGSNGLQRILGVFADDKTNTLWVCSSGTPTALKTFNLQSGAAMGSYPFPGGVGLCNDIAIAPDGAVYATDTTGGRVVRLKRGATTMNVWAQDSRLKGVDGIAFGDGSTLYVNNYFSGALLRIPVTAAGTAGPITPMHTSQPLTHPDGMRAVAPNTFLLVEGAGRLDRVTLDGHHAEVEVLHSGFDTPTAVAKVGGTAWVLTAMSASPPLVHAVGLAEPAADRPRSPSDGQDWPMMGYDVQGDNASFAPTAITAANVRTLVRRQVALDGAVDASAIYLHGVTVKGGTHNVFFVTTTYGKTIAVDADSGAILWEYTPAQYATWAGTTQITNATPAADPNRQFIYAAAPDGTVNKLAVADGHLVWSTAITLTPRSEKMAGALKVFRGRVIAVTGGYIGDRPPYQGHVAVLGAGRGRLQHVWNSQCSDHAGLLQPTSCDGQQSAIWGRTGATIDPATGNIFVATGNGSYDGKTNWGDSLIELAPDASRMLGNYVPENNAELNRRDLDLGSTSPVLLGDGVVAQGGKDGLIRLVRIASMAGTKPNTAAPLQTVSTPGGHMLLTSLARWTHAGRTWLFAADYGVFHAGGGVAAWTYANGKLTPVWSNDNPGTTPVVAGGLLYIYDAPAGGLRVYAPETGALLAELACGKGHWNSPIVAGGHIALPEGITIGWEHGHGVVHNASASVLDIWSLPKH